MGTNYYWKPNPPYALCGREDDAEEWHIGKSSGGWCFSLHVYPADGINTLGDWLARFEGGTIRDEYNGQVSCAEMINIITDRSWTKRNPSHYTGHQYYHSYDDFLCKNHACEGPDNLLRHKVDGEHCIGNGEGTWDYIIGAFC